MEWTQLPSWAIARAWVDPEYATRLLADTPQALHEHSAGAHEALDGTEGLLHHVPSSLQAIADTSDVRHLPLPQRPSGLSDAEIIEQLREEIGDDESFEWVLPAEIVGRALTDEEYRRTLLNDPASASVPEGIKIVANSAKTQWVTLQRSPYDDALPTLEEVELRIKQKWGADASGLCPETTNCCRSGTCDDDNPE
ncbi:hypothetical protein [Streptomyces sp. Y7]|uniref:hypothetical protein n=1 Tax=Streptomyces sp. Y7 TaxID=3342392 RepID=UPI00371D33D5